MKTVCLTGLPVSPLKQTRLQRVTDVEPSPELMCFRSMHLNLYWFTFSLDVTKPIIALLNHGKPMLYELTSEGRMQGPPGLSRLRIII